jgi:hypothetical protein
MGPFSSSLFRFDWDELLDYILTTLTLTDLTYFTIAFSVFRFYAFLRVWLFIYLLCACIVFTYHSLTHSFFGGSGIVLTDVMDLPTYLAVAHEFVPPTNV